MSISMEKLDRAEIKKKFEKGKMPSSIDFGSLIDSMVNILEEGFDKTVNDGLKLTQLLDSGRLLSFYKNIAVGSPLWFLDLGMDSAKLHFGTPSAPRVLSLCVNETLNDAAESNQIAVGVNNENPKSTLDVGGTIASTGRIGREGGLEAKANGAWQDITEPLTGCEAFEIIAGVGGQDADGKYALTHAIALNAFNGAGSIQYQQAHFGSKCNRIELQWTSVPEKSQFHYKLQIRVQCSYGEKIWIKYFLTRLWFDQMMLQSNVEP